MPDPLRTERLELAPWSEAHTGLLAGLAVTPAVMRHIGDGTSWTDVRIQQVAAANREHWREHGFGWRAARLVSEARPMGFIALNFAGEGAGVAADEYEIGWWLAPAVWGRGLAREGATALRDEAFTRVGAPSIVARIRPGNAASLGVARAIGLTYESEATGRAGETLAVLRLNADEWRGSPPAARLRAPASRADGPSARPTPTRRRRSPPSPPT
jgi:RimJ/RimL family protein N-acetyltransferase